MDPFDDFPENVKNVLLKLEDKDRKERIQNTERKFRLRQIPRETGNFLFINIIQLGLKTTGSLKGLEIGSSGGYSTIFQAMALKYLMDSRNHTHKVLSLEIDPVKVDLALNNYKVAELDKQIDILETDAKKYCEILVNNNEKFDFFFLDAEKEDYITYYRFIQKLASKGSVLFADNVLSHKSYLEDFNNVVLADKTNYSTIVPVGKGILKAVFL